MAVSTSGLLQLSLSEVFLPLSLRKEAVGGRMNTEKFRLIQLIDRLPDSLVRTVLDFVDFLLWKQGQQQQDSLRSDEVRSSEDLAWLNSDLSNLGAHEPYEWAEGELEQGKPIKYVPDKGFAIEE